MRGDGLPDGDTALTPGEWSMIRHFKPKGSDNFGDPYKMDFAFLTLLDDFRDYLGLPIRVNYGNQGTHVDHSLHYNGQAVDCVVDCLSTHPGEILWTATRFGFTGIGVYPNWSALGVIKPLGLHLEKGETKFIAPGVRQNRWLGVKNKEGHNQYLALDFSALKKYGLA